MTRLVVIGAGIGGLTAAACLARAGLDVTVLEAHVYSGGCAGTFYHQGYRFDAGATLAGGFGPAGPMAQVAQATGISRWPARPANPAMVVHLPDGSHVTRWTDDRQHDERRLFGQAGDAFWRWQEDAANALWNLALRLPPWPPQSLADVARLVWRGLAWLQDNPRLHLSPTLVADAVRPVAVHLRDAPERLRLFVDAQLLIAAQTTSQHANALYGAAALDLPRRGVVHLEGGMGALADTLADAVRRHGGRVLLRQEARRIVQERGRIIAVETKRGNIFPADTVIANLTPWNVAALVDDPPLALRRLPALPADGWGAFTVNVGLDGAAVPDGLPLHHQIVVAEPLAEGKAVFLSLSPEWDASRAPQGQRALTLSTHTRLEPWWTLFRQDRAAYEARKDTYTQRLLLAAERALPRLRDAAHLVLPGTPVTFQRFTRREGGWAGGFPQTNLLTAWPPRLARDLWLVGDSIFPGQSTAATALGGLRVAAALLAGLGVREPSPGCVAPRLETSADGR